MAKTIIKELIILLLLCLAIILILGVLLYGYVPTNKIIPEKVSYAVPENIKEELQETLSSDNLEVIMTYEVNSADLDNYERVQKLNTGKPNPFSSYEEQSIENNSTDNNTDNNTNNNSNSNNSNNNSNTQPTKDNPNQSPYMKNTGTK